MCSVCGEQSLDRAGRHASCCAPGESTRGHNAVRDVLLQFALHADPDNTELKLYANRIDEKRAKGEPTVPTILSRELETNPFLRADKAYMRDRWGGNSPSETFAALRAAKDNF